MIILTKNEVRALNIFENNNEDINLDEIINSKILNNFQNFSQFEKELENLSKKYREWRELENRFIRIGIFLRNGTIRKDFRERYYLEKFKRQSRGNSSRVVGVCISNTQ